MNIFKLYSLLIFVLGCNAYNGILYTMNPPSTLRSDSCNSEDERITRAGSTQPRIDDALDQKASEFFLRVLRESDVETLDDLFKDNLITPQTIVVSGMAANPVAMLILNTGDVALLNILLAYGWNPGEIITPADDPNPISGLSYAMKYSDKKMVKRIYEVMNFARTMEALYTPQADYDFTMNIVGHEPITYYVHEMFPFDA